ncbi:MAG: hypothetical protein ACKVOE_08710 [Rickettsiales bacterium]
MAEALDFVLRWPCSCHPFLSTYLGLGMIWTRKRSRACVEGAFTMGMQIDYTQLPPELHPGLLNEDPYQLLLLLEAVKNGRYSSAVIFDHAAGFADIDVEIAKVEAFIAANHQQPMQTPAGGNINPFADHLGDERMAKVFDELLGGAAASESSGGHAAPFGPGQGFDLGGQTGATDIGMLFAYLDRVGDAIRAATLVEPMKASFAGRRPPLVAALNATTDQFTVKLLVEHGSAMICAESLDGELVQTLHVEIHGRTGSVTADLMFQSAELVYVTPVMMAGGFPVFVVKFPMR